MTYEAEVTPDEDEIEIDDFDNNFDRIEHDEEIEPVSPEQQPWYSKVKPLLDHVNQLSKRLCRHPGFALSVDEMMRKFKGRSMQTHRMKNKPIKEGYKFFAICDAQTGFVYHFFPDGQKETNKIVEFVKRLIETVPSCDTKKYVVIMDNYFTLSSVMIQTRQLNGAALGTARHRRGWPPEEYKKIKDDRFNSLYVYHHKDNYLIC